MSKKISSSELPPRKPRIAINAANLVGKRFGRLTVLRRDGNQAFDSGTVKALWLCQCDCGKCVTRSKTNLMPNSCCGCMHGAVRSKPRKRRKCRLKPGESARHALLATYKHQARARKYVWELSDDEFYAMTTGNCHYCGSPPMSILRVGIFNGTFTYNGVDRLDNDQGYTPRNTVGCCKQCNRAKSTLKEKDFLDWLHRVCTHLRIGLAATWQPVQ